MRVRKQQLEPDIEQQTGSKSGKEYIKNFSSKGWENIWKDSNWKMKTFLTWKRKLWTKSRVQSLIQDKPKRNTPRHIVIKTIRMKNKNKVLKAAREKQWITYKRIPRTWPAAVSLTNKNAEKASDKFQHSFMIETLQKEGIEGTDLNIPEAIYDSHSQLHTQMVKNWKHSLQDQKQG